MTWIHKSLWTTRILVTRAHFLSELTVDAAMGTVRASALFRCALARNVLHDQSRFCQVLVLTVGLGVPEQVEESLCSLLRPAAFVTWRVPLLALVSEGNDSSLKERTALQPQRNNSAGVKMNTFTRPEQTLAYNVSNHTGNCTYTLTRRGGIVWTKE